MNNSVDDNPIVPTKEKRKQKEQRTALLFAIASWLFLFSSMYVKNGKIYLGINYLQILVYFVFGLLTTWIFFLYYAKPMELYYPEGEYVGHLRLPFHKVCLFVIMVIAFTGIWQMVLLPMSGLGIIEYAFVMYLLFLMLINFLTAFNQSKKKERKYIVFVRNPITIVALQAPLFLIKIATWFTPENFYSSLIEGNGTIRTVIALLFGITMVAGILALYRKTIKIDSNNKTKKVMAGIGSFFGKIISAITTFVLGLTRGPVIVVIITAFCGLVGIFCIAKVKNDILSFIESILKFFASSGKYQTQISSIFIVSQIATLFLYVFFLAFLDIKIDEGNLIIYKNDFEKRINDLSSEQRELVQNKLEQEFRNNKKEFMYNYTAIRNKIMLEIEQENKSKVEIK